MEFKNMDCEDKNINVEKIVGFWVETSDDDFKTMEIFSKQKISIGLYLSDIWYWKSC